MMRSLIIAAAGLAFAACSASKAEKSEKPEPVARAGKNKRGKVVPDSVAYFAGGCFWGVEHYLEQMDGVASVESGYMGGHVASPTYEQVSSKKTGHIESVRVRFDSKRVSYEQVAKRFFEIHDPTQANGQGPDIGPQYISAVFYTSAEQKKTSAGLIARLEAKGYKVATKLIKADKFWPAEGYHQNYYARKGSKPYCHTRVRRFDK